MADFSIAESSLYSCVNGILRFFVDIFILFSHFSVKTHTPARLYFGANKVFVLSMSSLMEKKAHGSLGCPMASKDMKLNCGTFNFQFPFFCSRNKLIR